MTSALRGRWVSSEAYTTVDRLREWYGLKSQSFVDVIYGWSLLCALTASEIGNEQGRKECGKCSSHFHTRLSSSHLIRTERSEYKAMREGRICWSGGV